MHIVPPASPLPGTHSIDVWPLRSVLDSIVPNWKYPDVKYSPSTMACLSLRVFRWDTCRLSSRILVRESGIKAISIQSGGCCGGSGPLSPKAMGSCDLKIQCSDAWEMNSLGNEVHTVGVCPGHRMSTFRFLRLDGVHTILLGTWVS